AASALVLLASRLIQLRRASAVSCYPLAELAGDCKRDAAPKRASFTRLIVVGYRLSLPSILLVQEAKTPAGAALPELARELVLSTGVYQMVRQPRRVALLQDAQ